MLIIGAKGHAKEILDVFEKNNFIEDIFFFDDISEDIPDTIFSKYPVIKSLKTLNRFNINQRIFVLGLGNPFFRRQLSLKFQNLGWKLSSLISNNTLIGNYNVVLEKGLNIMHHVIISSDVEIGEGCLINARASIHHNVRIGKYCEISPGVCLTGNVIVNNFTFIGAGSIVIPKIKVGKNCIIGAGSVVNRDIPDNSVAVGIPAKIIKKNQRVIE